MRGRDTAPLMNRNVSSLQLIRSSVTYKCLSDFYFAILWTKHINNSHWTMTTHRAIINTWLSHDCSSYHMLSYPVTITTLVNLFTSSLPTTTNHTVVTIIHDGILLGPTDETGTNPFTTQDCSVWVTWHVWQPALWMLLNTREWPLNKGHTILESGIISIVMGVVSRRWLYQSAWIVACSLAVDEKSLYVTVIQ